MTRRRASPQRPRLPRVADGGCHREATAASIAPRSKPSYRLFAAKSSPCWCEGHLDLSFALCRTDRRRTQNELIPSAYAEAGDAITEIIAKARPAGERAADSQARVARGRMQAGLPLTARTSAGERN
jgi:hypothetical protein